MSAIAITAFSMPGPRAAEKASARTRLGKDRKISVMHQNNIDPVAQITGGCTDDKADRADDHRHQDADIERGPGAVDQA